MRHADEPVKASGPLLLKLVDVIAAHLIDDEQHDDARPGYVSANRQAQNERASKTNVDISRNLRDMGTRP